MRINTAVLGEVEVGEDQIFHLTEGLFGFDTKGDFALVTKQEDDVTLMWLQAVDSKFPCFVVFNPFDIIDGYEPVVENGDLRHLGAKSADDLLFYVIAVVPEDLRGITVNLKSPVVVNKADKKARQVILANRDYPIRFPLFDQEEPAQTEPQTQAD